MWDNRGTYPKYRRRSPEDGGRAIITPNGPVDNRWIVPYNPYLCLKYNAHINVEAIFLVLNVNFLSNDWYQVCVSALATKYLFKYITKGPDRSMVRVEGEGNDEIS